MEHLQFIVYGIPWPLLSAWLDALVQFIGGFGLMVGLGTRLWSVLVGFAMLVASVVVTIPDVLKTDIPVAESNSSSGAGSIIGPNRSISPSSSCSFL